MLGLVEHIRFGAGYRVQLGWDGERAELVVRGLRQDEDAPASTDEVMVWVDDVDGVLEAARAHGASTAGDAGDQPYGERQAGFVDPFGHAWVVTQSVRDVEPTEWGGETVVACR